MSTYLDQVKLEVAWNEKQKNYMGYPFSHVFHATCKISNPFILIIYLKKKYNPNMYKNFCSALGIDFVQ